MTNWLQSLETNPEVQGLYHQVSPYVNNLETKSGQDWNNILNTGTHFLQHLETKY